MYINILLRVYAYMLVIFFRLKCIWQWVRLYLMTCGLYTPPPVPFQARRLSEEDHRRLAYLEQLAKLSHQLEQKEEVPILPYPASAQCCTNCVCMCVCVSVTLYRRFQTWTRCWRKTQLLPLWLPRKRCNVTKILRALKYMSCSLYQSTACDISLSDPTVI